MLALASAGQPSQAQSVQALPPYQRASGVSGTLSSVGSDTLANLMTLWADDFKRFYPNVNMQVQAAGSSTAPTALIERTANLGPMSRPMKNNEIQAFENRFGYAPTAVPVALDALAIFVHRDNPIQGLSLAQVDAIYSANRRCGYPRDITRWGQLGLTGPWEQRDIQLFGRNSVSGTYGFFKEAGLCSGDLRKNVNEQPGSGSVVQSVSASLGGIGYSGIGYVTASVRPVPIAARTDGEYVDASPANSLSGRYPLARYLLVYVNKAPGRPLPPLEREFVKLMLSRVGQESVLKDGHIPLTPEQVRRTLELLDIETRP